MTTVAEVIEIALRKLGDRTGTLGTVTVGGTVSTAILNGLVNTTGDNQGFPAGGRLFFLEGPATPRETLVKDWVDQTGTAEFRNLTTPPLITNPYIAVNRENYSLYEVNEAFNEALREGRRTYRQVIPLTPNLDLIPLTVMDWLRGGGDVQAVWINQSPLWLHNEDFALWQHGASSAPDGYTLEDTGMGATVARITGGTRSPYLAQVTAGDATARLTQGIPQSLTQWLTRRIAPIYTPLRAAAWLSTLDANSTRVFIRYTEGASGAPVTTYAYSDYLTADGVPHYQTVSLTPSATMDNFTWGIETTTDDTFEIGSGVFMQNTQTADLSYAIRDMGSQAYVETQYNKVVRNVGGQPTVELTWPLFTPMQLIVYSRRPLPEFSEYDEEIDPQYARALEWGLLAWLLRTSKPNQDRSRLDRIMQDSQREWARFLANTSDLPVPRIPAQSTVWGA